jgi:hypothetical protein
MKSTERLYDNLANQDYRKTKVDLGKAVEHVMKQRVADRKQKVVDSFNKK